MRDSDFYEMSLLYGHPLKLFGLKREINQKLQRQMRCYNTKNGWKLHYHCGIIIEVCFMKKPLCATIFTILALGLFCV